MRTLSKVKAAIGNSRPLEMFNYGYPYPKFTWSHNGKIFPNESHKDYGYASVLQIDDIHVEDFGRYYIDMINEYGFTRSMIELVPNGELKIVKGQGIYLLLFSKLIVIK